MTRAALRSLLGLAVVVGCVAPGAAASESRLYVLEYDFDVSGAAMYVLELKPEPDGTEPVTLFAEPISVQNINPFGLAVDPTVGRVFWHSGAFGASVLHAANMDGTEQLSNAIATSGVGLSINRSTRQLYFGDEVSSVLSRIDYGLTEHVQLHSGDPDSRVLSGSPDPVNGTVYFHRGGSLWRMDNDGGQAQEVLLGGRPRAIAVDPGREQVYYIGGDRSAALARVNFDGAGAATLRPVGSSTVGGREDVEVDGEGGKVYWIDWIEEASRVMRCNLDGTGEEIVYQAFAGARIGAIDLFIAAGPECAADFDGADGVQVADIFAFLRAWFANDASADFDGENGIQVADIFAFLRSWFAGC